MDIVFKIAQTIRVLSYGRVLGRRHARRDPRQSGGDRGLSRHRARTSRSHERVASSFSAEDIDVFYGTSQILFGVDLAVAEGQTMALLGRNGAGKTTTLKAIAGLAPPRRGRVRVLGTRDAGPQAARDRTRRHRLRAGGPAGLPRAQRRGQSGDRAPRRGRAGRTTGTLARVYEMFPLLDAAAAAHGRPAFRRRAADADDRAHADGQSDRAAARRAERRAWRRSSCSASASCCATCATSASPFCLPSRTCISASASPATRP